MCGLGEGEDFGLTRKRGKALEIYHKVWGGGGRESFISGPESGCASFIADKQKLKSSLGLSADLSILFATMIKYTSVSKCLPQKSGGRVGVKNIMLPSHFSKWGHVSPLSPTPTSMDY